jgi:polyisoprenoid-binding protein YceI
MNRRYVTAVLTGLLLTGASALAQGSHWELDTNHSQANFQIRHMGVSTVRGSLSGVSGTVVWDENDPAKSRVEATLKANTVSTNNEKRDTDLRSASFFDVEKYPTLTFKSTQVKRENGKLQVVGDLTLGGVTKSVTLEVDGPTAPQKGMGGKMVIGFSATGVLKRSDFNFAQKVPSAIVGDEVKFTLDAEADQ